MAYTRIHRLLRVYYMIQSEHGLNASELARRLEMTSRTIFRDINELRGAGFPITHDPATGGYSVDRGFFLKPVDLEADEAMALTLLPRFAGASMRTHAPLIARAMEKIRAVLPPAVREPVQALLPVTRVDAARGEDQETFDAAIHARVNNAIFRQHALECVYESPKDPTDAGAFRFDPYALYFGQRAWYVVGHHHARREVRTLKLSRLTRCRETKTAFTRPADFSLDKHFGKAWRMIKGSRTYEVRLRFDAQFADTVADTHWHPTQQTHWTDDRSAVELHFSVDGLEEIVWWVLGYGPHCEVLAPAELRDQVAALATQTAANYRRGKTATRSPKAARSR